jgi:Immunoglobulin I-set domain/Beta-propeller repeat
MLLAGRLGRACGSHCRGGRGPGFGSRGIRARALSILEEIDPAERQNSTRPNAGLQLQKTTKSAKQKSVTPHQFWRCRRSRHGKATTHQSRSQKPGQNDKLATMNHKEVGRTKIKHGKSKLAVLVGALALTLEVTALSGATITAQPQSQTVWAGTNITFAVTATGTDPLGYQWRKGGANLTDGGNVSGAATAALALANVRLTDAGNYDVVVTDTSGSVTSQVAVLTVSLPPGTELGREWTRIWGSASDDTGWSVAADKAGNAYVVGDTAGALDGQTNLGGLDVFLTKYSASGVKVWTREWGSTADDNNAQVVVDNAGNIYVTGSTRGATDGQPTYVIGMRSSPSFRRMVRGCGRAFGVVASMSILWPLRWTVATESVSSVTPGVPLMGSRRLGRARMIRF